MNALQWNAATIPELAPLGGTLALILGGAALIASSFERLTAFLA